jgi:hypothetical protein
MPRCWSLDVSSDRSPGPAEKDLRIMLLQRRLQDADERDPTTASFDRCRTSYSVALEGSIRGWEGLAFPQPIPDIPPTSKGGVAGCAGCKPTPNSKRSRRSDPADRFARSANALTAPHQSCVNKAEAAALPRRGGCSDERREDYSLSGPPPPSIVFESRIPHSGDVLPSLHMRGSRTVCSPSFVGRVFARSSMSVSQLPVIGECPSPTIAGHGKSRRPRVAARADRADHANTRGG